MGEGDVAPPKTKRTVKEWFLGGYDYGYLCTPQWPYCAKDGRKRDAPTFFGKDAFLGILTATYLSARLGLVPISHYVELKSKLEPWHYPYGSSLLKADRATIFKAIKHDKKNTDEGINCILTRGPGRMEKTSIDFISCLQPAVNDFIDRELAD